METDIKPYTVKWFYKSTEGECEAAVNKRSLLAFVECLEYSGIYYKVYHEKTQLSQGHFGKYSFSFWSHPNVQY